jgi:arylsulfatase
MDFCYESGGLGRGGEVVLSVDGAKVASGGVDATVPYYFSFDETLDVGVDLGTPVSDDYPAVGNEFSGTVHTVRIDLREEEPELGDGGRYRRVMASQ